MLSLLDSFSAYHQILMNPEDEEKTSFITLGGMYSYHRMPEGLRNAGPTFSRMIDEVFNEQKGKKFMAYVDDLVVKSDKKETHIQDLQETFENLTKSGHKLNPKKCILGYLVSARGIEANHEKIAAIMNMKLPATRKQV